MGTFRAKRWDGERPASYGLGAVARRAYGCQLPGFDAWVAAYPGVSDDEIEAVGAFRWFFEEGYELAEPFGALEFGYALKHIREGTAANQEDAEPPARPVEPLELVVDYELAPEDAPLAPVWDEGG